MRTWILCGCLAAVTAGGVCFVAAGVGSDSSHCGPCVAPANPESEPKPAPTPTPATPDVVEVVDVAAALARPADPKPLPFVSFDEPPLARPLAGRSGGAPDVIPVVFSEPVGAAEIAPMPRAVRPPDRGPMPLASPGDPF
jgi:hypothetical protein